MNHYDFNILSWEEFEEFTKDLLTAEMGVTFESFANGPDGGVDLRHSSGKDNRDIIVQCKRYKNSSSLIANLKKERKKIDGMTPKPRRYVLSLSLDLKEEKINEIVTLFAPYLIASSDILGPKQLNSMLSRHEDVESRHYKLWLSSSNVLKTILASRVRNYTSLIKEEITDTLKLYSPTPSFEEAMNALKSNGFIIIAGEPGVGKTTLANVMSYYLLGGGDFKELIALPQDIHEAVEMMSKNPKKKQLFLFDDFLGSNYLDQKLSRHEDSVFRTLINHIQRLKKNKALIMTTREYILNQAQQSVDIFKDTDFINAKYVINLSKYDITTKAKILYNHIAASDIPEEHLRYFIDKKVYRTITKHRDYSPRLVGSANKQQLWKDRTPEAFCDKMIDLFDHPWSLYEDIFENKIGQTEQNVLLVMMSIGRSIQLDHLHSAVVSFDENCSEIDLKKAVDVLDGTFLRTSTTKSSDIIVDFLNPTINDFLAHYYKSHHYTLQRLIRSAVYLNQITHPFVIDKSSTSASIRSALGQPGPILVDSDTKTTIETKVISSWRNLRWIGNNSSLEGFDLFDSVSRLLDGSIVTSNTKTALLDYLFEELSNGPVPTRDVRAAINIFEYEYDLEDMPEITTINCISSIAESILTYDDLSAIVEFGQWGSKKEEWSKMIIEKITSKNDYIDLFTEEITSRLSDGDDQAGILNEIIDTLEQYGLGADFIDTTVDAWGEPPEDYDESKFYSKDAVFDTDARQEHEDDADKAVDDIFKSLLIT